MACTMLSLPARRDFLRRRDGEEVRGTWRVTDGELCWPLDTPARRRECYRVEPRWHRGTSSQGRLRGLVRTLSQAAESALRT